MAIDNTPLWVNNFNDEQSTDTVRAALSGAHSTSDTVLYLTDADQYDGDGVGYENYNVNDYLRLAGNNTQYKITELTRNNSSQIVVTITPGLHSGATKTDGAIVYKDAGGGNDYKGNHSSAANHIRLRNQGII